MKVELKNVLNVKRQFCNPIQITDKLVDRREEVTTSVFSSRSHYRLLNRESRQTGALILEDCLKWNRIHERRNGEQKLKVKYQKTRISKPKSYLRYLLLLLLLGPHRSSLPLPLLRFH